MQSCGCEEVSVYLTICCEKTGDAQILDHAIESFECVFSSFLSERACRLVRLFGYSIVMRVN